MNKNDTPTNKQNGDDAPLFPARTFPAVHLTPGDHPPAPPMQLTDEQQKTLDKIKADAAAARERAEAGIEVAFEKAEELRGLFVRFSEMAATPKERAEIDRFLESMRRGESGLGLAYDALLLGARFGRDPAKDAEIQQSQKRIEKEMARLADAERETQRLLYRHGRKLDDVPPAMQKLQIATHDMAKATMQFRQLVKLKDDLHWEIYDRIEHKKQNQSEVARALGMESYQVSRAWGRIVDAFTAAGYPIAKKFSLRSAKMDEKDGMLVAKNRKKRKQFQKPRPSA